MAEQKVEFKAGDCVVLKSGGPSMTIKDIGEYSFEKDVALCEWFDGTKIKSHVFKPESLKKHEYCGL
jgi:uncharacterized protein YodC (DUF2158 family)